jgi:hypothetical protein
VVPEYPAEVPDLLVEQRGLRVWIAVSGKQQRVAALDAHVLVMIIPIDEMLVRVVSEKTGQRVTDARQGAVEAEVRGTAPARPLGRIGGCEKDMIVDVVAPHRAGYSSHGSLQKGIST